MPSLRRLSFIKHKKESQKTSSKPQPLATKSFKVKADLVNHHHQHHHGDDIVERGLALSSAPLVGNPPLTAALPEKQHSSLSTHSSSSSSSDMDDHRRGGGYCQDYYKSYEERWSPQNLDLVFKSWNMTPEHQAKLLELKERVKDVDHFLNDPHQLVYFLIDEKGNVDNAEEYLREVVEYRQSSPYSLDKLLSQHDLPDDYDYFPLGVLDGTDRDGNPIQFSRLGAADAWGLYKRHGRESMVHHGLYYQELLSRGAWIDDFEWRHSRKPTQATVIFDLQGLSRRHISPGLLPVLSTASRIIQDNYPAIVKRLIIVRAPAIFKMIWGLVKHFFDQELRDLMIFATDDADSQRTLERFIDPDVLPHCLHPGGLDGKVARGFEHIVMEGGLIPPEGEYKTPKSLLAQQSTPRKRSQSTAQQSQSPPGLLSDMSETLITNNIRRAPPLTPSSVTVQGQKLFSGSFQPDTNAKDESFVLVDIDGRSA